MKKIFTILLALLMLLSLGSCAGKDAVSSTPADKSTAQTQSKPDAGDTNTSGGQVVLLVSAAGTLDDRAFNQACYQGVKDFCAKNNMTYTYYQPPEDTAEAQLIVCDTAVKAGAEFVIINSDQFKVSASMMTEKYPDVTFIIYDTVPENEDGDVVLTENCMAILFAEEQAGFLAGYSAVVEGYRKVGFMGGMAVPAVVRFGYGFVEGADQAAVDLKLADVEIMYNYAGNFEATPENQARAASWYQSGTELIFVAAGPMGASVFAAAEQNNGFVIGVDSDQSGESETIISSAMKDLSNATYTALESWKSGSFEGGKIVTYTAKEGGVSLPWETSKFKNFTKTQYEELYKRLADDVGGISSSLSKDTDHDDPTSIPLEAAKLTYIE